MQDPTQKFDGEVGRGGSIGLLGTEQVLLSLLRKVQIVFISMK